MIDITTIPCVTPSQKIEDAQSQVYDVGVQPESLLLNTGEPVENQGIRKVVSEQVRKMDAEVIETIPCKVATVDAQRKMVEMVFLRHNKTENFLFPLENLQQIGLIDPLPEDEVVFSIKRVGHGIPFGEFSYVPPAELKSISELRSEFPSGFLSRPA